MEFKDDDRVLICQRVAEFDPPVHSHVDSCMLCGKPVWRARSSPEADYVICLPCGLDQLAEHSEAEIAEPTKEQWQDMLRWWRMHFWR